MIVECDPNRSNAPQANPFLKCATLPSDTGEIIQKFLGISGHKFYDWRAEEGFGESPGGYWDEFDAIDLSTFN